MTALLTSSLLRVESTDDGSKRPVWLAALIATGWAVAAGLLTCCALAVVGWFAGSGGGVGDALRVGLLAWLMGHGSGVDLPDADVTVIPLGLSCALGLLLVRAGTWVGQTSAVPDLRAAVVASGLICLPYVAAVSLVAVSVSTASVRPGSVRAALGAAVLAAVCGGGGVLRGSGLATQAGSLMPSWVRAVAAGVVAGSAAMLAIGGLLVSCSLAFDLASARAAAESLQPGLVGGVLLMLIGLAAVPNAILCAAAFAAGPGFAFGLGTVVAPSGVTLGPLPAFPLLAALPAPGAQPWWVEGLEVAPLVAGLITGIVVVRRVEAEDLRAPVAVAAFGGAVAGITFGLLTSLATGSAGPGRMAVIGPQILLTTVVIGVGMAAGAVIGGVVYLGLEDRLAARADRAR